MFNVRNKDDIAPTAPLSSVEDTSRIGPKKAASGVQGIVVELSDGFPKLLEAE